MELKKKTIEELKVILKEEFEIVLSDKDLRIFAHSLTGYFNLLDKNSRFGNHPASLIDKVNQA